ncbi:class II aaRS and biotin synthetase [Thozetella sp. PMI_491]|nr:class II aaRS and biotin synthetase [Thozetella sp. PMI_491]
MSARKLNVLVYAGPGSTLESVRHCIYSLRRLLSPNYAVIPITETVLLKEPWAPSCALLVFPGGADLGYCRDLNGAGNKLIAQYVRSGGAYFGFCAGGYYGSRRCEFEVGDKEMEVIGSRELAFFPGTCKGSAFKGFKYHSESGARAARVIVKKDAFSGAGTVPDELRCYYNGGGVFAGAEDLTTQGVLVLAEYGDTLDLEPEVGKAAVVYSKVGDGSSILTGPHPEFAAEILNKETNVPGYADLVDTLAADDSARISFLKACLTKLGLEVSQEGTNVPSLSRLHLSAIRHADVGELLFSLEDVITREEGEEYIKAENDLFHLEKPDSRWSMAELQKSLAAEYATPKKDNGKRSRSNSPDPTTEYSYIPKRIVSHEDAWPEAKETPYFNHSLYYWSLKEYRNREEEADTWGDALIYGEVLTSTNTILDKNPKLLAKLPTGFTVAATTQVAGRGRGSNVWVSPPGSMIFSTVINHPAQYAATRPIVFIQYLAAIAIVDAIQDYDKGYGAMPVKLKWPNDIYALDPTKSAETPSYVKIGGILANCAYCNGNYQIVLGIGINTNNSRPTTSLDALASSLDAGLAPYRIERLIARILTRLESLYAEFIRDGFNKELERKYYSNWLHTNQIVSLEAEGGVKARVLGITTDWGMLLAEELKDDGINGALRSTGKKWALQSDENSFDFWKGLIKRKV